MLPLLPFYAALLVVLSVLFAPNIMEALPAPPKPVAAIVDHISSIWSVIGTQLDLAEETTENIADSIVGKVGSAAEGIVNSLFEEPVVEEILPVEISWNYLPEWAQPSVEIVTQYAKQLAAILSGYSSDAFNVISGYADIVYIHLSLLACTVAQMEPINSWITEYLKLHNFYVTPAVEYTVEKYTTFLEPLIVKFFQPAIEDLTETWDSLYTGDSALPGPVLYAVVILMLFVFINVTTRLSKLFLKDIFWINQGVTSMYGPTSSGLFAAVGGERGDVYDSMKANIDLVRDEIEELELELDLNNSGTLAVPHATVDTSIDNSTTTKSSKSKKRVNKKSKQK